MPFDPHSYMINEHTTLRDFQLKLLEILKYFDWFCREHGLTYYLVCGSLLGAVRHGGFVPWDCDIDVTLPREDYERLEELWNRFADTDHYSYKRTTETYNCHSPSAFIMDNYTTYIRAYNKDSDINHGMSLDVSPLDAISDDWFQRQIQKISAMAFCLFNTQRLPVQRGKLLKIASWLILSIVRSSVVRYKIWRYAEKIFSRFAVQNCKDLGEMNISPYYMGIRYPKEWFGAGREIKFEDIKVIAPLEAENYLERHYGAYQELPPENECIPNLNAVFVDLNEPFTKYKGKYYCL